MDERSLKTRILSQIRRFGLTTQVSARRTLAPADSASVRRALRALVDAGRLFRHRPGQLIYFTCNEQPLSPGALRRAYMTLAHCSRPKPPLVLVSRHKLVQAGAPKIPAYISDDRKLVWVYTQPLATADAPWGLRDQLVALQATFRQRRFLRLVSFAREGAFAVDYLMVAGEPAVEMRRWLERHPLVSRLHAPAVRIPVRVWQMRLPAGCP